MSPHENIKIFCPNFLEMYKVSSSLTVYIIAMRMSHLFIFSDNLGQS
jgi:hypothetical protein